MNRIKALFLIISLLLLTSCAFFNAIYNGRMAYNMGIKLEKEMTDKGDNQETIAKSTLINYDRAIEKADKAISYYPKQKRFHDDAYYLKGQALYKKGDYSEAINTFKILQNEYPNSKKIPLSWLAIGLAYGGNGDFVKADEAYTYVIDNFPKLNKDMEVSILRADLAIELKGKAQAIRYLQESLEKITDLSKRVYIINQLAGLYIELKLYDKALLYLDKLPKFSKKYSSLYYSAERKKVECYQNLDRVNDALILIENMLKNSRYLFQRDDIMLLKGEIYLGLNEFDQAYKIFEDIVAGENDHTIMAKSWYYLSGISIDQNNDLIKGKEQLTKAKELAKDKTLLALITSRLKGLESVDVMKDSITDLNIDDTLHSESYWKYRIAEGYWLDVKLPDSAIVYYDNVLSDSTTNDSIKSLALFAKALIYKDIKNDTIVGDSLYRLVILNYPSSEVAKQSQIKLNEKVSIFTRRDSAEARFKEAEDLYESSGRIYSKDAYYSYLITALKYEDISDVAARSLYAAGVVVNSRTREVVTNDSTVDSLISVDTAAAKIFGKLCEKYPESEQCIVVTSMLESGMVKGYVEDHNEKINRKDSVDGVQSITVEDSLIIKEDNIVVDSKKAIMPSFNNWF